MGLVIGELIESSCSEPTTSMCIWSGPSSSLSNDLSPCRSCLLLVHRGVLDVSRIDTVSSRTRRGRMRLMLCLLSLSRAVLKSSRIMLSVKHLATKENFQNGLITPIGMTGVTDKMSTTVQMTLRHMQAMSNPNLGDTRTISPKLSSYWKRMFQKRFPMVKIHHGSLSPGA